MVIGHARHGKDTVGEALRDFHGLKFASSSMFCAETIMLPKFRELAEKFSDLITDHNLAGKCGCPDCDLRAHFIATVAGYNMAGCYAAIKCYEDRHSWRPFWHDEITRYCEQDGDLARLAREIFSANDVYCGCRNDREFLAARAEGAFDYAVWVDASRRCPLEPSSSMKLEMWMADFVLDNNGPEAELAPRVGRMMRHLVWLEGKHVTLVEKFSGGERHNG